MTTQPNEELALAIVGMAGRFPGAEDINQFWSNLTEGKESLSRFTKEELREAGLNPDVLQHSGFVPVGGVLEKGEAFDASFFRILPRDAELLDPQQRVFLECAWHGLEHAGYAPGNIEGAVGVFAGAGFSYYLLEQIAEDWRQGASGVSFQRLMAADSAYLATRTAYKLNLKGPTLSVASACSTSLVAVHLACQSLLDGECDMALAGGVKVAVPQTMGHLYQAGAPFSPDGHCRAFDEQAAGCVAGNGVGVVVLKRLKDALRDRDTIHSVILASATNNDGADKIGYTAPSLEGQAAVITEAISLAGVEPSSIGYVETHGTATALGDALEIQALNRVFSRDSACGAENCAIGSLKTNIGHLDTAAGVAGLIKTTLMLKHGQLVPSLHFNRPHPRVPLHGSPFRVATALQPWRHDDHPRRAGISAFGVGGSNVHMVLQQPPSLPMTASDDDQPRVLTLSATEPAALRSLAQIYRQWLSDFRDGGIDDICFTAFHGRAHFPWRLALAARTVAELTEQLAIVDDTHFRQCEEQVADGIVLSLSDREDLAPLAGAELYHTASVFARTLDSLAQEARDEGDNLLDEWLGRTAARPDIRSQRLRRFALDCALAEQFRDAGATIRTVRGEGRAYFLAQYLSGRLSRDRALANYLADGDVPDEQETYNSFTLALNHHAGDACYLSGVGDEALAWWRMLADLYVRGVQLSPSAVSRPDARRVPLPCYPFQRQVYHIGPGAGQFRAPWDELVTAARQEAGRLTPLLNIERLPEQEALMETLSASYIASALQQLGAFGADEERCSLETFARECAIRPELVQLSSRLLEGAVEYGLLQSDGQGWWDLEAPDERQIVQQEIEARELWAEYPVMRDIFPQIGRSLAQLLQGKADLREIYFPQGSLTQAHSIYAGLPTSRYFNGVLAATVGAWALWQPPHRLLRVLEIGAGTGASTEAVLPLLREHCKEYCFTDVSPLFLEQAEQRFVDYDFVRYRLLDIECDPALQEMETGCYDLVIAANVLHVAGEIDAALMHARRLLAPGGVLMLYEITRASLLGEITTGLLLPPTCDQDVRHGQPFMTVEQWHQRAMLNGFSRSSAFPEDDSAAAPVGERLILLRADGLRYGRDTVHQAPPQTGTSPTATTDDVSSTLYRIAWQDAPGGSDVDLDGGWLICQRDGADVSSVLHTLETAGAAVRLISCDGVDQWREVLAAAADLPEPRRLLVVGGYPLSAPTDGIVVQHELEKNCLQQLALLQALEGSEVPLSCVALACRAGQDQSGDVQPLSHALWSFGRTLSMGHRAIPWRRLDWDGADATVLLNTVADPFGSDEAIIRRQTLQVPCLQSFHAADDAFACSPQATYLIAGGLGGLGMQTARWLVKRGARHLAVIGRKTGGEAERNLRAMLAQQDVELMIRAADLTLRADLDRVLDEVARTMPPLRGVIHSAVWSGDGFETLEPAERMRLAFNPKVAGGWNMHQATHHLELDFFLLFSSAVTHTPIAGLPDYAAANAFLEGLARYRHHRGMVAQAIAWGSWSDVGAVADAALRRRLEQSGVQHFTPERGLATLGRCVSTPVPALGAMLVDWRRQLASFSDEDCPALYRDLRQAALASSGEEENCWLERWRNATEEVRDGVLLAYLQTTFAALLRLDAGKLTPDADLIQLGLDSLLFLEVATLFSRELNVRASAGELFQRSTIRAQADYLSTLLEQPVENEVQRDEPALESYLQPLSEEHHEPFPLTDMQQAYWMGRRAEFELGNVAAHGYIELEGENWDIPRLEQAWRQVVRRHDMLRAVILPQGNQQIIADPPLWSFVVEDMTALAAGKREERLLAIRSAMSHQLRDPSQWPLFDIRISRLPAGRLRLHFSLDNLTLDGRSLNIFLGEWVQLYRDPHFALPELTLNFRDYVLALRRYESSSTWRDAWRYWQNKLDSLPDAPPLPRVKNPADIRQPRFSRYTLRLEHTDWQQLCQRARQAGLTAAGVLCSAYAEILCCWSGSHRITLNLPTFNRLPLHPQVNQILGEFTSLTLLEVDNSQSLPFVQRAKALQRTLLDDLAHGTVSGVRVLRELGRRRNSGGQALMPVVFSSMFGLDEQPDDFDYDFSAIGFFGEQVFAISQTPQVWLDNHIHESDGGLNIYWDAVEELFPAGMIGDMFVAYCDLLRGLTEDDARWRQEHPVTLPPEQ
ncbi:SDR family NAD(P)-dependent oxidoreductase, partial [Salmonella enterica]|nr:SDR family NAD(P)-dependent oxidoreductase [Salmonella enterica]